LDFVKTFIRRRTPEHGEKRMTSSSSTGEEKSTQTKKTGLGANHENRVLLLPSTGSSTPYILIALGLAIAAALAINFTAAYPPFLVVGAAIGLILTVLIFQKPELGAYILIFTVFTNLSDLFTEKGLPSINKPLVGIVMFSIFANYVLRTGKISLRPGITRIEVALLVYCLTVLASSLVATNQSKAFLAILDLIKDIAVGFCVYATLDTKDKLKSGARVLLYSVGFVSVLGVIHTMVGSDLTFWGLARDSAFGQLSDSGELRYGGPIAEANIWGQILVAVIPIALYRIAKEHRPLSRLIALGAASFMLLAMLFTQSRGAFLALAIVLTMIAIELRIKSTTLLALACIGLIMLFIVPSKYTERLRSLGNFLPSNQTAGSTVDESVEGRREKMLTGLAMFGANPFLGVGFANYSDNYWSYAGNLGLEASARNVGTQASARQPHSLYIEIMAETGLFGIISFLAFLGFMLNGLYQARARNSSKKTKGDEDWSAWITSLMMSIVTFLIAGFFLHGIGFRFIWVLCGLALTVIHLTPNPTVRSTN
jgi:O-antigen ligase